MITQNSRQQQSDANTQNQMISKKPKYLPKILPKLQPSKIIKNEIVLQKSESKNLLKLIVVTWNLMGQLPEENNLSELITQQNIRTKDLVIFGTQQCQRSLCVSFLCESKQKWEAMITYQMGQHFVKIASEVLQGLHIIAFASEKIIGRIHNIKTRKLKTGFCGLVGNKGAIELTFMGGSQLFQFINCHLDADKIRPTQRNQDLLNILNKLVFTSNADSIILFGDLNYRISITQQQANSVQTNQDLMNFLQKDQLRNQKDLAPFLEKFHEGNVNFLPTYKLDTSQNTYDDKRVPGWTDRIFYSSKNINLIKYSSNHKIYGSDHRPVYGQFEFDIGERNEQECLVEVKGQQRCSLM